MYFYKLVQLSCVYLPKPCFCVFSSGGLVHRSTGASSSSEASGWGPPASEKDLDVPDVDDGYEDKTEDSKTVRLTLMEEVLLLGIKDREVIMTVVLFTCQLCYSDSHIL